MEQKKKGLIFSRIERVSKSLLPNLCLLLLFCRLFRAYFHLCHFVVFFFLLSLHLLLLRFLPTHNLAIADKTLVIFFCFACKLTLSILNISA